MGITGPKSAACQVVVAALGLTAWASNAITPVDQNTQSLVLLIGLAVGVDYALFVIRRSREERAAGASVVSLLAAWNAYQATRYVNQWGALVDELARQYGTSTLGSSFGFTYYIALAAMVAQGVLMLMAFQKLKAHQKAGWNLVFYSSLISLVMGVLYLFTPYYGVTSMIGVVIGVAIGWWILFQIRAKFAH